MPTTVTKTIGATGDYATIALWVAACPANLVTADQIWRGELQNQTHTIASELAMSGITADATRYIELTCVAGASFADNANVQTNALRANGSNGALISGAFDAGSLFNCQVQYTRFTKLQMHNTGSTGTGAGALNMNGADGGVVNRCILSATAGRALSIATGGSTPIVATNTLCIQRGSGAANIGFIFGPAICVNCTFVCPSDIAVKPTVGIEYSFANPTLKNCAIFGAAALFDETPGSFTYSNCYTDIASPPTGFTQVAYDTSTGSGFEGITAATLDFRIKSTSALKDAGVTDATYAATDIAGTSRPSGSAYDVGAWEFVAIASPTGTISVIQAPNTSSISASRSSDLIAAQAKNVSAMAGSVTITGTAVAAQSPNIAIIAGTNTTSASITTPPMKNNTGFVLGGETGVVANVYNPTTGALVLHKTGLTSDGNGVVVISDPALAAGTTYAYEIVLAANGRRLPVATAA